MLTISCRAGNLVFSCVLAEADYMNRTKSHGRSRMKVLRFMAAIIVVLFAFKANAETAGDRFDSASMEIDAYQQALRIDPEDAKTWYNLGNVYRETDQISMAIEAYQQALRIDPENAIAWYNLGVAYGETGQTAKEIEAYQQTLRIDPENADAWYNLGTVFRQTGKTSKAMEIYHQLEKINPSMADKFNNQIAFP